MAEPERRRRRPAVSCLLCRQRKIRCNREAPCSNCVRSKDATCVYRDALVPQNRRVPLRSQPQLQGSFVDITGTTTTGTVGALPLSPRTSSSSTAPNHSSRPTTTTSSTPTSLSAVDASSPCSLSNVKPAQGQTAQAVQQPSTAPNLTQTGPTSGSTFTRGKNNSVETTLVDFSGKFYIHSEQRLPGQPQSVTRSVTHKTRLFGQSHWVNSVAQLHDMFMILERLMRDKASKAHTLEQRCKALARVIKARRAPPWPCPPTSELPTKAVADALVECYLRTSEAMYRVVHIPTFMREYEAVYNLENHNPDPIFLVQLKLVLAIGASTHDPTFSLRPSALRWVYEAQTWFSAPEFKHRLGIPGLQISVLLLIAREATGTDEDLVWASVGTTLRMAMYMGLHRNPGGLGPKTITSLGAEMRRRLWNTILELAIQSSLDSGGPPLISLADFDTEPPGNFDDEQLMCDTSNQYPTPKPNGHFTQTTVAIALRKTFSQRLAVAKYLNDLASCGTYAETLKHDADLRKASKAMSHTLPTKSPSSAGGPSDYCLRVLDLLLRRYFLCLHLPFFSAALQDTAFTYSRKVVVESAIRTWRAIFPAPVAPSLTPGPNDNNNNHRSSHDANKTNEDNDDIFRRHAFFGSGLMRTAGVHAFVAVAIELKTLLREEEEALGALGPIVLRPDLLGAMRDFKTWVWWGMEAGETNSKGYLVVSMVSAKVEALRRGFSEEETADFVIAAAEESIERCIGLLEGVVRQGDAQGGVVTDGVGGGLDGLDLTPDFMMEDWDFMGSNTNTLFDSAGGEFSGWFSDGILI